MIERQIDNIRILRKLGEGGSSNVYLAYDNAVKSNVTLKILKDNAPKTVREAFMNEADILRKIGDRRAPKLIREGYGYIEISYVPGESLFQILRRKGKIGEKQALLYGKDIIGILKMLHERPRPIIYRDLKPSNIVVDQDGHASLIDYGAARIYRSENEMDTTNLGTGGYAAPEQYGYLGQTDQQTDIYAFGMTILQLITGIDIKDSLMVNSVKEYGMRGLSNETAEFINKCIKPSRNNRFKSCREVEKSLNKTIRAVKWKKPLKIVKLAVVALVISAIISNVYIYSEKVEEYIIADAEYRVPEIRTRLGYARLRVEEMLKEYMKEEN